MQENLLFRCFPPGSSSFWLSFPPRPPPYLLVPHSLFEAFQPFFFFLCEFFPNFFDVFAFNIFFFPSSPLHFFNLKSVLNTPLVGFLFSFQVAADLSGEAKPLSRDPFPRTSSFHKSLQNSSSPVPFPVSVRIPFVQFSRSKCL